MLLNLADRVRFGLDLGVRVFPAFFTPSGSQGGAIFDANLGVILGANKQEVLMFELDLNNIALGAGIFGLIESHLSVSTKEQATHAKGFSRWILALIALAFLIGTVDRFLKGDLLIGPLVLAVFFIRLFRLSYYSPNETSTFAP